MMLRIAFPLACAAFGLSLLSAYADGGAVVVRQVDRQFHVKELTLDRGQSIRFTNEDEFLHQIYVEAPSFSFDSNEQAPGENVEVAFGTPGEFEVRCGIHPRMLLTVTVEN